jgi:hypothetical protein
MPVRWKTENNGKNTRREAYRSTERTKNFDFKQESVIGNCLGTQEGKCPPLEPVPW